MTDEDIMTAMTNIRYGWVDKSRQMHFKVDETFAENYILQVPSEVLQSQVGVCWDQVELERFYFQQAKQPVESYFIVYYDGDKCPTHTFLVYQKSDGYYWFEHAWEKFRGIHAYATLQLLLDDVKQKFLQSELGGQYIAANLCLYRYPKPKAHMSVGGFYKHCESGENINL